jgi:hypothetical protein
VAIVGVDAINPNYVPPNTAVILQIFNEPDVMSDPVKWKTPVQYAAAYAQWRTNYPLHAMFTAGLASGVSSYYADFLKALTDNHPGVALPDAVAVHPYTKNASEAAALLNEYSSKDPSIPVVVTEWNRPANENEIVPFQNMLAIVNSSSGMARLWNSWFPWCAAQEQTTPGLVTPTTQYPNGQSTAACSELVPLIGGVCPAPS